MYTEWIGDDFDPDGVERAHRRETVGHVRQCDGARHERIYQHDHRQPENDQRDIHKPVDPARLPLTHRHCYTDRKQKARHTSPRDAPRDGIGDIVVLPPPVIPEQIVVLVTESTSVIGAVAVASVRIHIRAERALLKADVQSHVLRRPERELCITDEDFAVHTLRRPDIRLQTRHVAERRMRDGHVDPCSQRVTELPPHRVGVHAQGRRITPVRTERHLVRMVHLKMGGAEQLVQRKDRPFLAVQLGRCLLRQRYRVAKLGLRRQSQPQKHDQA